MKKKNLFITLGLALGLGIGAAVGVGARQETKAAKADYNPQYIYFQWTGAAANTWGSWGVDSTEIYAYFFNKGDDGSAWPGVAPVDTVTVNSKTYCKYEVNASKTLVIFDIYKWSGDNNQTEDLTIPTNGANCFVPSSVGSGKGTGSWVEMYPDITAGKYLRGGWTNGWYPNGQVAATESPSGTFTAQVTFGASGKMKMVQFDSDHKTSWIQAASVTIDGVQSESFKDNDGNVVVSTPAIYTVVVSNIQYTTDWYANYVLTSAASADLNAATEFASGFTEAMEDNCPYTSENGSSEKVVAAWKSQAGLYSVLSEGAKEYIADGLSSTVDEIIAFASSYDWIYGHYAGCRDAKNGGDFADRNPTIIASYAVELQNNSSSVNSIIIVATIAAASLLTVGGYFLIKKKHEN